VFLDRKEYAGDLFTQLEQVEAFVKNHISLRGEIKGLQRTDTYEIPEAALREALVNAVIHRDYTNQGRDIKVGVYDDIVNVVSPGGFPNTLTAEALLEGRSEIRNRVIARVFKELGYIEQWGSGIQRIKSACIAQGLAEPRIREKGDFVDVEFYRPAAGVGKTAETGGSTPENVRKETGAPDYDRKRLSADDYGRLRTITDDLESLGSDEVRILNHLLDHAQITRKEATEVLEQGKSKAHLVLRRLVTKGLIARRGQGRGTCYVLAHGPKVLRPQ